MTELIETRINFADKALFSPMINPYGMINYGIHEGAILQPNTQGNLLNILPDSILDKIHTKCSPLKFVSSPHPNNNYYKVMEETPPFYQYLGPDATSQLIHSLFWFEWYIQFYEKKRTVIDDTMIQWWAQVIDWGMNINPHKSSATDQMLLQYGWNPSFEWNKNLNKLYI